MLQKWGYKNGSTVFLLTSTKTEWDLFHEQKRLVGDFKTVERKRESRNNHQFAAVVQNFTIQWKLPVKNHNFTRDGEEFTKVRRAVTEAKSYSHGGFFGIWQIFGRKIMESSDKLFLIDWRQAKLQNELYVE